MPRRAAALAGLTALVFLALAGTALAAPAWKLTVTPNADYALPGHYAVYKIEAENVGTSATSNATPIKFENIPPAGTTPENVAFYDLALNENDLNASPVNICPGLSLCEWPSGPYAGTLPSLPRHKKFVMAVIVKVPGDLEGPLEDTIKVSGGGAPAAEASASNEASSEPAPRVRFNSRLTDSAENPYTQAGGHPYQFVTDYDFATYTNATPSEGTGSVGGWVFGGTGSLHEPKEIVSELPAGMLANPQAVPHCRLADYYAQECELKTQVGVLGLRLHGFTEGALRTLVPIYNLQPSGAYPGQLGATIGGLPLILINASVRSASDYGVTATNIAAEGELTRVHLTLWGVPADPSHNLQRPPGSLGSECSAVNGELVSAEEFEHNCELKATPHSAEYEPTPFLTMPTECSGNPLPVVGRYNTWEVPGVFAEDKKTIPAIDGCNALSFEPSIEARPTTNIADAPSGLEFKLHIPQNEDPEGVATPSLKQAVVKLPAGLTINPSSAEGLAGCSEAQIGLHSEAAAACPEAAKLGTVKVHTPLLSKPLEGSLYLATPYQNPSGSLLAGYISLEGEGVRVKLAGRFETDGESGQITARFTENPQVPFEDLELDLFGGAHGSLRTPATCGSYETTSTLTPYSAPESGPPATPGTSFETTVGPNGGSCLKSAAEEPNQPRFRAGTETPQAGIFSPFSLRLSRDDGSQQVRSIETTLPPGLVGKLAGVAYCPDSALSAAAQHPGTAEQASPSCPAASEVGTVDVGAGAGPTPLFVTGHAYLAGPYKGAPLSLAIITPAVAGPFDLGTVVVRTALFVDPYTARIKAVSDPIPSVLEGIPLDIRSVTLRLSRPNFTLNPTSCEAMSIGGTAISLLGGAAPLSQRFQVGGCQGLGFKPKLSLKLKGGTKRHTFPALTAVVTMPPGGANIGSAQVTLPHSSQLEQAHITAQVCTQPQLASQSCPKGSIYGYAKAETPLLSQPLEGPVYLGVGFGHQLPDLVAELNGQIRVLLHGKVDTGREDALRNTFEIVPDAPVTKFTLHLFGGKKSLIVNSENICGKHAKRKALAIFTAQNGEAVELEPTVANSCKKKGGKGRKHRHRRGARR